MSDLPVGCAQDWCSDCSSALRGCPRSSCHVMCWFLFATIVTNQLPTHDHPSLGFPCPHTTFRYISVMVTTVTRRLGGSSPQLGRSWRSGMMIKSLVGTTPNILGYISWVKVFFIINLNVDCSAGM